MKIAGFVLMALGLIGFIYGGIGFTTRETVVSVGSFRIEADKEHSMPLTPIASGALLVAGIAVLAISRRRQR